MITYNKTILLLHTFIVVLLSSCSEPEIKSSEETTSKISNAIFLEMFNEYSAIIHDYQMIIDSDDFDDISEIESITKRASLWVERWDKEIKKADLSLNEKLELIIEYDKLSDRYKNKNKSN